MNNEKINTRYWNAYVSLEKVASQRQYRPIGLMLALNLLVVELGVSYKIAQNILRCLSKSPFNWINLERGQITVKPMGIVKAEA